MKMYKMAIISNLPISIISFLDIVYISIDINLTDKPLLELVVPGIELVNYLIQAMKILSKSTTPFTSFSVFVLVLRLTKYLLLIITY